MSTILHIAEADRWQRAQGDGSYHGDTLATEGFIHCSRPEQVVRVANAIFAGRGGLVLLCIDEGAVAAEVRYEPSPEGEHFPHIYGPINLSAVTRVLPLEPLADGTFALPAEVDDAIRH